MTRIKSDPIICEVEGCLNLAKYELFKVQRNGTKVWLHVCRLHEGIIGGENARRAGGESK